MSDFETDFGGAAAEAMQGYHGESCVYKAPGAAGVTFTALGVNEEPDDIDDNERGRDVRRAIEIMGAVADVADPVIGAKIEHDGKDWSIEMIGQKDSSTWTVVAVRVVNRERTSEGYRFKR